MIQGLVERFWLYLAAAGAALAVIVTAWRRGGKAEASRVNALSAGAKNRMLDASVAAPKEKDRVVEDLRTGRF